MVKGIPVIVAGVGGVGCSLLRQLTNTRSAIQQRNGIRFDILAVADSRSVLFSQKGLDDTVIQQLIQAKESGQPIPGAESSKELTIVDLLAESRAPGILVDVTAADGMEVPLNAALDNRWGVALANKKPLALPWNEAQRFFNNDHVRHESTVGGGQPVIATMRYLMDVNDRILHIEGQMSGCLGFICGQLERGVLFSDALHAAKDRGYTEPDPREDLGGKDALRKSLILGRMAGWSMEPADIQVESLYPGQLETLSVDDFMQSAASLDADFKRRFANATSDGNTLRYVAEVSDGVGKIGLKAIPKGSPLANLKYVSFQTDLYNEEALMIGGKGAGVEMTAAGVLGDMISLAREVL